ncbi:MAG: 16S rRNA (uracil(1498)-N(3))-methyltransferase [Ruminococcus sp.]|nr:16S rRNA (uracil(1498)-N(3))-methyltransferase [Ruminococcus sp.]
MPRFFTNVIDESNITIGGDDARHIGRSLRMKISEDTVRLELVSKAPCASEPSVDVTLFQAVPKLDKLEHIIQKTVELGISRIVPVLTRRCVSRPNEKNFAKKLPRLNKISEEAAKQSGRGIIPEVTPIINYKNAIAEMKKLDRSIILYEEEDGCSLEKVDYSGIKTIGLLIGSEGGFNREEAELAENAGVNRVWLGKRILRCETAPTVAMSLLMFLTNNL